METRTPAKLWVDALRSGEYEQGRSCLKKEDKFCCLGVLCDVYVKQGNKLPRDFSWTGAGVPQCVYQWVGLSDSLGSIREQRTNLGHINDYSEQSSFAEIAALIESRPPGLFIEPATAQQAS